MKRKIWLSGDTHFNHPKLQKDLNRPENYEELIWAGYAKLGQNDILIHLGDICAGTDQEVHNRLNKFPFTKILVKGNHDNKSNNWYMNNGWNFVCHFFQNKYFGKKILFSHTPKPKEMEYDINIHAHFHNISEEFHEEELIALKNDKQKLFALEEAGYEPILLEKFLENF